MTLKVTTDAGMYTTKVKDTMEAAQFLRSLTDKGFKCVSWELR